MQQRVTAGLTVQPELYLESRSGRRLEWRQNEPFIYGSGLTTDPSITFANDPFNIAKQYGKPDYDVRNYFSASVVPE